MEQVGRKARIRVLLVGGGLLILAVAAVAWLPRHESPPADEPEGPRGVRLWGRVVDEAGLPIEGAEVWGPDGVLTVTDAKGWVRDRAAGSVGSVSVTAPGRERVWRSPTSMGMVRLRRVGSVRGRVVDRDGAPVAGARVVHCEPGQRPADGMSRRLGHRLREGNRYQMRETKSDATGAFILKRCPAGEGFVVASAYRYFTEWVGVDVVPGEVIDRRVVLPWDPLIRRPRQLHVSRPDGMRHDRVRVISRHEEDILISHAGESPLSLSRRFGAIAALEVRDVEECFAPVFLDVVAAGDDPLHVELGPPELIDLVFVDSSSTPATDGHGYLSWPGRSYEHTNRVRKSFTVDPAGRTTIREPEAPFRIHVTAPGFGSQDVGPFDPKEVGKELVVELEPRGGARVRVLRGGLPVPGARVSVTRGNMRPLWFRAGGFVDDPFTVYPVRNVLPVLTDDEGRLVFTVLQDDKATFVVAVDGLPGQGFGPFRISKDPPAREITLELEDPGVLEGRVLVRDGESPEGRVVLACPGWNAVYRGVTDAEGQYRIEGLPRGHYQVRPGLLTGGDGADEPHVDMGYVLWRPPHPRPWDCRVRPRKVTSHDLDLRGDVSLSFRLKPVRRERELAFLYHMDMVREHGEKTPPITTTSLDFDGKASLRLSRGGRYVLRQKAATTLFGNVHAYRELTAELDLTPGENRFEWNPVTGAVLLRGSGSASSLQEHRFYDVTLRTIPSAGITYEVKVRTGGHQLDGAREISDLPVGDYEVTCARWGGPPGDGEPLPTRRIYVGTDAPVLIDLP